MKETLRKALQSYPVFSVRDLAGMLNKNIKYTYLQVYRWKKKNIVYEIEKGKYTLEEDPFLISSWIVWPSYISGWAAMQYHQLTEQLPFTIQVITTKRRKRSLLSYGNAKIVFTTVKSPFFTGFHRVLYHQHDIFIAEKEKALIDALATKRISLPESIEIIKHNEKKINRRKLFAYAGMIKGLAKELRRSLYD